MTTTVLNTKISGLKNKLRDKSNLVTGTVLNKKIAKLRIKFLIILNILLLKNLIN